MSKFCYFLKLFVRGCEQLLSIVFVAFLLPVLSMVGFSVFFDALFMNHELPQPQPLTTKQLLEAISNGKPVEMLSDPWSQMQTALRILDKACPQVSAWVRDQEANKSIIYETKTDGLRLAAFSVSLRILYLYPTFFNKSSRQQAAILAHEFCHSRQGFTLHIMRDIALLAGRKGDPYIEEPAYAYGDLVERAIAGGR